MNKIEWITHLKANLFFNPKKMTRKLKLKKKRTTNQLQRYSQADSQSKTMLSSPLLPNLKTKKAINKICW